MMKSSIGWLAVYYDNEQSNPEIIRVFKPKSIYEKLQMMKVLAFYNYNTCALCPLVKAEIDGVE